jgi:hypothetical protein
MIFTCDVCGKTLVTCLEDKQRCFVCEESEQFWRKKIADDVESAWKNLPLRLYYSNETLAEVIIDFIRKGNSENL